MLQNVIVRPGHHVRHCVICNCTNNGLTPNPVAVHEANIPSLCKRHRRAMMLVSATSGRPVESAAVQYMADHPPVYELRAEYGSPAHIEHVPLPYSFHQCCSN